MSRTERTGNTQDPLEAYRNRLEEEREARFHAAAEEEDSYGWRKRPSSYESRTKKTVRKLGTSGRILKRKETTGDERTKYRTRNGVTWRTVKTEEELKAEVEAEAEREALRKKRSYEHRNDKGRPVYTRYVIKLNVVGYPKPYYYCGDEIGWGTYECAVQYLGKRKTLSFARRIINNLKLEDNAERYDSIEVISIPKELNKEWLYCENMKGIMGRNYEEEDEKEIREEFIKRKKRQNDFRNEGDCSNCICNSCDRRDPLRVSFCDACIRCKDVKKYSQWKDECERYIECKSYKHRHRLC